MSTAAKALPLRGVVERKRRVEPLAIHGESSGIETPVHLAQACRIDVMGGASPGTAPGVPRLHAHDRHATMLASRSRRRLALVTGNLLEELSQCGNRVRQLLAADPQPELMAVR